MTNPSMSRVATRRFPRPRNSHAECALTETPLVSMIKQTGVRFPVVATTASDHLATSFFFQSDSRSLGFDVVACRPLKNESTMLGLVEYERERIRNIERSKRVLESSSSFPRDGYFQLAARFVIASSRPFASQNLQAFLVVSFSVRRGGG